jgi:hypothetical protein
MVIDIRGGIQLQVMREAPRLRLYYLFPPWRTIGATERERKHQRGDSPAEILAGHPHPRKRFAPTKRDLAFAHAELRVPDGFDRKAHSLKDLLCHDRLVYPSMRRPIRARAARSPVCKSARVSTPPQSMPKSTMVSATMSERPVMMVCAPFSRTAWMVLFK